MTAVVSERDAPVPTSTAPGAAGAGTTRRSGRERRAWWTAFGVLFGLILVWSLSMPLFSSPDEDAHVVKAAAVARGQWLGTDELTPRGDTVTHVRVPEAQVGGVPCYAFKPKQPANCAPSQPTSTRLVDAGTLAGHYQPLYYALVGLGSLIAPGVLGLYLMRAFAALLCAALLASALQSVRAWGPGLGVVGFVVALTPMVFFMAAGVNPSGLEITAGVAVWASLLALLHAPTETERRVVVRLVVAACALVLSRSLSPLWLAVIVTVALLSVPATSWWAALRRTDVRVATAVVAVATVAATTWIVLAGALTLRPARHIDHVTLEAAFLASMGRLPYRADQMVGVFGWLDTVLPDDIYRGWAAAVLIMLVVLLVTNPSPRVLAVALLAGSVFVLPSVIEASQERVLGYVWQGRYTLPVAVGLPLLMARQSGPGLVPAARRLLRPARLLLVPLALAAQVAAFLTNLRRNTVGRLASLRLDDTAWQPPLGPRLLVVAFLALTVALAVLLLWPDRSGRGAAPAPTGHDLDQPHDGRTTAPTRT